MINNQKRWFSEAEAKKIINNRNAEVKIYSHFSLCFLDDIIISMLTNLQVMEIIDKIKGCAQPSQMYLFGSYATGTQREDSDIDVAVIKKTLSNKREELVRIKRVIASSDYSVDLLLFSEVEFNLKKSQGWRVMEEITSKGKAIPC